MSDATDQAARLRSALERLAQADESWVETRDGTAGRQVASGDALGALLVEISDTVMPAKVILSGADGQVALAVAGRRVQGLLGASDTAMAGQDSLLNTVLDAEDMQSVAAVGQIVRAVAEGAGPFTLRSEIAPRLGAEAEPGLSPDQLREVWGGSSAPAGPLEAFLLDAEGIMRGGVLTEDGVVLKSFGDASLADPLVDVLNAAWPGFETERQKIASDHQDPSLTCWQQSGGPVVAVANWPGEGLAALAYLPDNFPSVLSLWNKVLAE